MLALLASRMLGVVRQVTFNAMFGAGYQSAAYFAASRLPDSLYNLIAGGALIHAFVPVFLSYEKEHGENEAWRLTSLIFNVMLVALTIVILFGELVAPAFVTRLLVPGLPPAAQQLTTSLTRIMLLQPLILGLGTIGTAILNSRRQFLLPALSLAVYNFGLLAGLLATKLFPPLGIYGPTYGTLLAVTLQGIVLIPGLLQQGVRYSFVWNIRHPGFRLVMILLLPNALAIGVSYVGNIVDTAFSSYMKDPASIPALQNAEMLQALPIALIAQAIGQSLLPHLAVQASAKRYLRMRQTALKVIGASLLLTIPAALLLIVLGKPAINILFRHGAFTTHAANLTYLALIGYALAIPGQAAGVLISSAFFALKDAFTPFLTNTYALVARWGLLFLFFHLIQGQNIILAVPLAGVAAATSEGVLLTLILLLRLRKRMKEDKGMQRLQQRRLYLHEGRQGVTNPTAQQEM